MKVLSLLQPWASLIAIGAKRIETRSWAASYRGPLLIHASKTMPKWAKDLCYQEPFKSVLIEHGLTMDKLEAKCGRLVAHCTLAECIRITDESRPPMPEQAFGDYTGGRYLWLLKDVSKLHSEIVKGQLNIWNLAAIPVKLTCPECKTPHVDEDGALEHLVHLCLNCNHQWQPFVLPTVGV